MRRIITLTALIGLATAVGSPKHADAQTTSRLAPPVPGPYQAAPAPRANPYGNAVQGQALPYWMRPQPGQTGRGAAATSAQQRPRNYIPGWVWSPYPPNAQAMLPSNRMGQPAPGNGAGSWPSAPQRGFDNMPWSPPIYAPNPWPNAPYGTPQNNGAYNQPNQ